jgi:mono/diheme cytochrome c family protein
MPTMKKTTRTHLMLVASAIAAAFTSSLAAQDSAIPFVMGGGARNAPLPFVDGKTIYEHVCQSCHMADAKGGKLSPSTYPALAGNAKLAVKAYPAIMVVNGLGAMPAFGSMLTDEQIASLVNYLRTQFGNSFADPLSAMEVKTLRPVSQSAPAELRGR